MKITIPSITLLAILSISNLDSFVHADSSSPSTKSSSSNHPSYRMLANKQTVPLSRDSEHGNRRTNLRRQESTPTSMQEDSRFETEKTERMKEKVYGTSANAIPIGDAQHKTYPKPGPEQTTSEPKKSSSITHSDIEASIVGGTQSDVGEFPYYGKYVMILRLLHLSQACTRHCLLTFLLLLGPLWGPLMY